MKRCRDRGGIAHVLLVGLTVLFLSCQPEAPVPQLPEVEYSGCWAVSLPGPVCALWPVPEPELRLWVKADPGMKVEIRAGEQPLTEVGEESGSGRFYRLKLPQEDSRLTVRLRQADGTSSPAWELALTRTEMPAWFGEIARLEKDGRTSEVRQRLLQLSKTAPRKEQWIILRSLAELARRDGRSEEQEFYLRQGIAADHAEGCMSGEIEKATFLARLYLDQSRFIAARKVLDSLNVPPQAPAESKCFVAVHRGLLAARVGDYRTALAQLREGADLAKRTGMKKTRWKAELALASLLQDLGRSQEASVLFARLHADPRFETKCDQGDLLTTWAWSRLLAREADEPAEDPVPLLQEAQAMYDANPSCAPPERQFIARLHLALALQQAGRWKEARQALDQARPLASHASLRQRLWWYDLEARSAIAAGQPERALRLYADLAALAERALSLEGRFRAALGLARAELALGHRDAALEALAQADRRIDEQSWHIPVHEGRDTLVGHREEATRMYLQLLLEAGRPRDAFLLARQARSRLLRQLMVRERLAQLTPQEQGTWVQALSRYRELRDVVDRQTAEEWQLPVDQRARAQQDRASQLAQAREDLDRAVAGLGIPEDHGEAPLLPPRPGEVVLIYHPLPQGWVGFAADERSLAVHTFELPARQLSGEALAGILLAPFRPSLERAGRVRVLPYGRLRLVDFHTLPFGGEPLLARRVLVYGLDLPTRPAPAIPGRRSALLVADPQGDLAAARQEASMVAAAVRAWEPGWTLERLEGTEARAEDVRAALPNAGLFHYAGHGTFAGFAGWDSVLTLADGSPLTVGDLLALPRAPAWVLLSSCDAARSSEQAPGEGIGLAQAFLLAGSESVIAATRRVPDSIARDLLSELYRGWQPGMDLPRQFQRAQQACIHSHQASDCASFRLLEP